VETQINKRIHKKMSDTVKKGQTVSVHYVGTLDDGTEFDNSRARGDVISFEVGSGQLIPGFDNALPGMTVGETKNVAVTAADAYGDVNPQAVETVPKTVFPPDMPLEVGGMVQGRAPTGQPVVARINAVEEDSVTLDMNHPLAGKNLNFEIELVSIIEPTDSQEEAE
tara:strand:- start:2213 stop:2713 length:501 start_codon:yes stop_codon:yes gene_type:complete